MKLRHRALLIALSALTALPLQTVAANEPQPRPRIGLVLAGGGAKGGAHVGVLKVIEELRIPIDCVAGTSMGALIGAGYASGQSAAEVERFLNDIDWSSVIGGQGRRVLEPVEQKRFAGEAGTQLELGFHKRQILTPSGLANSSAIDDLLRTYVARARMVPDFNDLPIPFRAIATDMVTGNMVVLDHGDLATAMRASMAIPGAFSPVLTEGYILADGGLVRNIPVDVARATCADIVIVVNLVEPPIPPERLVQATQLLARSMDVMLEANERVQLESLTDRDIRIDVPLGDIGTADFDRVPETVPLGEAAARAAAGRLGTLSVPEADYMAWRERVNMKQEMEGMLANVRIEGLERMNPEYARSYTKIRPGDTVDIDDISADARRMSVLEGLDTVAYRIERKPGENTLVWLPKEVSVGTSVLRPSLGIFADGGGDLKFQVGVQHAKRWLNDRGAQWRNNLQLGYESILSTSLYQPLDVQQRFFVEPGLLVSRSAEDLYEDGDRVATYRFIDYGGSIDLGWNLSRFAQLRVGYVNTEREAKLETGQLQLPQDKARDAGISIAARYDSRNTGTFATSGSSAAIEYLRTDGSLGSDRDWERIEAGFRTSIPIRRNLVWLSLAGGKDLGDDLPGDRAFSLGGSRTLPAYQFDELRVDKYWLAEAVFLRHLKDLVPIKNQAIYGGIGLQAAGLYDLLEPGAEDDEVYSVSAYLGGATPIGTFTLGLAGSSHDVRIWLSIGRPIGKGSILNDDQFR